MLWRTAPIFALKSKERQDRLSSHSMLTLQEIMTDDRFEADSHVILKKPDFFFGDAIAEDATLSCRRETQAALTFN